MRPSFHGLWKSYDAAGSEFNDVAIGVPYVGVPPPRLMLSMLHQGTPGLHYSFDSRIKVSLVKQS